MAKTNQIKKVVNGEIADADDVNQIVENAGNEGGGIPYDPTSHQREGDGTENLGGLLYPWGSFFVNQDAELVEVSPTNHAAVSTVLWRLLRTFINLKDAPASYSGQALKFLRVNAGENAVEFATSPNKSNVLFSWSGMEGGSSNTSEGDFSLKADSTYIGEFFVRQHSSFNGGFVSVKKHRWTKIPGVTTLRVHARGRNASDALGVIVKVDCGGQNAQGTIGSTSWANVTPFAVDVSGLSDGTVYDLVIQLKNGNSGSPATIQQVDLVSYSIEGE